MKEENKRRTLQKYLRERIGGENINYHRIAENYLGRCRERMHEDASAAAIVATDDFFRSLPNPVLTEDFSLTDTRIVDESEVLNHIKDYYVGLGFDFAGYDCGFWDFRKADTHISVNLTWLPYTVIVSVHDKGGRAGIDDV